MISSIGKTIMKYAKQERKKHPNMKWTECVKKGAARYKRSNRRRKK